MPAVVGPGLILLRRVLNSRYDPNREDLAARKQWGQAYAIRKEDWEQAEKELIAGRRA